MITHKKGKIIDITPEENPEIITVTPQTIEEDTILSLQVAKAVLGLPEDFEYNENTVCVDVTEINNLVQQNRDLKSEVGKLVGLFQHFTGMFTGGNILSLAMKIPSLINDPGVKEQVEKVLPIIEKYKHKA